MTSTRAFSMYSRRRRSSCGNSSLIRARSMSSNDGSSLRKESRSNSCGEAPSCLVIMMKTKVRKLGDTDVPKLDRAVFLSYFPPLSMKMWTDWLLSSCGSSNRRQLSLRVFILRSTPSPAAFRIVSKRCDALKRSASIPMR